MVSDRRSDSSAESVLYPHGYRELFDRYWHPICQTLYNLLGDWDDAQDLALEAFTQLALKPPRVESNLPGWLYRVAMRLGLNRVRDYRRRRKYEELAEFENRTNETHSHPEGEVDRLLEQRQVRTALHHIKPRSASLLLLRYSGLSYGEIAKSMDIAPGSIGTLLARAEKEFQREYLKSQEAEDE